MASRTARGAEPAPLAAERDELLGVELLTAYAQKSMLEAAALQVGLELLLDVLGQRRAWRASPATVGDGTGNGAMRCGGPCESAPFELVSAERARPADAQSNQANDRDEGPEAGIGPLASRARANRCTSAVDADVIRLTAA